MLSLSVYVVWFKNMFYVCSMYEESILMYIYLFISRFIQIGSTWLQRERFKKKITFENIIKTKKLHIATDFIQLKSCKHQELFGPHIEIKWILIIFKRKELRCNRYQRSLLGLISIICRKPLMTNLTLLQ